MNSLFAALEASTERTLSESIALAAVVAGVSLPTLSADQARDSVLVSLRRIEALLIDATRVAAIRGAATQGLRYCTQQVVSEQRAHPLALLSVVRTSRAGLLEVYVASDLPLSGMQSTKRLEKALSACEVRRCLFDNNGATMSLQLLGLSLHASLDAWTARPQIYA